MHTIVKVRNTNKSVI